VEAFSICGWVCMSLPYDLEYNILLIAYYVFCLSISKSPHFFGFIYLFHFYLCNRFHLLSCFNYLTHTSVGILICYFFVG
jgi:hypothetical protein